MRPDVLAGSDRILLVRPDNVGDVVLLAPAIRAIRESHRHAVIHTSRLAGGSHGRTAAAVDRRGPRRAGRLAGCVGVTGVRPGTRVEFIERLRGGRWDAMVVFTSFSQTAFGAAYAAYLAGIPIRAGHAHDSVVHCSATPCRRPIRGIHQAERALDLVEGLGIDVADRSAAIVVPPDARHAAWRLLGAIGIRPDGGYILVVPGASCSARRSRERYAAAARTLSSEPACR